MKHRDFKPCVLCGKGVAHGGSITFFRLRIERMMLNPHEIERAHGMELLMGVSPRNSPDRNAWAAEIANVMGPDADLAKAIPDGHGTVLLCEPCALSQNAGPFFMIYEAAGRESVGE